MLFAGALVSAAAWSQEDEPPPQEEVPTSDTPAEVRLEQVQKEMTRSLARLEETQRQLSDRERGLEEARAALAAAEESQDPNRIESARSSLVVAEETVAALREDVATEQLLYDRAVERFRITRQQASLADDGSQSLSQESSQPLLLEAIQRRGQVDQAELQATLAQQRVDALRAEIEILEDRQEGLRGELDQINLWLDEGRRLDRTQRQDLTRERQRVLDEERTLDDRIGSLRGQLVLAETSLRIKEEAAERELADYRYWLRQLVTSLSLLLITVVVLLVLRFLVARYVEDPDRRYALNRTLSIAMTLVLMIGLAIIFLRQFPHLITGIGVVLAGVAIALQEVILSFFGFFAVRGARGYRIGDWVRIGDHYGEVVDISLLVTLLEEVTPIDFMSHRGGSKTGSLIWINNNAIFREKMTNYTRGFPYIWTTLAYTITFESDWHQAERILREIVDRHDEILTTAKLARKRVSEVASEFAIKVDNTAPRIRTWTAGSGVELRLRFMVHPRRRRALIDTLNREVMDAFAAQPDIDFAYDTLRVIPTPTES